MFGLLARVAEWQTRRTQNPLSERACGFESHLGHRRKDQLRAGLGEAKSSGLEGSTGRHPRIIRTEQRLEGPVAGVSSAETGSAADTIDKLLTEHASGRPTPRFDLPHGATMNVDAAGMLGTGKLADLFRLAQGRSWRVALVDDPLRFSSVGRGGMFGMLVDTHGGIELDRVHRFSNDWEIAASLQLRRGDPAVGDTYDTYGRLHRSTAEAVERAAVALRSVALRSVRQARSTALRPLSPRRCWPRREGYAPRGRKPRWLAKSAHTGQSDRPHRARNSKRPERGRSRVIARKGQCPVSPASRCRVLRCRYGTSHTGP